MPKLAPGELQELLQRKPGAIVLLDIREPEEYAEGHIRGAVNTPLTSFDRISPQLLQGKRIVIYCTTGARNYNGYRKLRQLGYGDISQAVLDEWEDAGLPVDRGQGTGSGGR
jgi:rhodanese-related sulfurtransferase